MAIADSVVRYGAIPSDHVPDVLKADLDIVFCGTALGFASAKSQAYYAHPGNLFWKTLYRTGLTPKLILPTDYREVLEYGIGLTDLCKDAYGLDTQLPADALNAKALQEKIAFTKPKLLAFTSKTAAAAFLERRTGKFPYGLQPEKFQHTKLFVLPSPSGQARVFWNESIWQDLADLRFASRV